MWLPLLCGLFAHYGIFIRGEWHLRVFPILFGHFSLVVVIFFLYGRTEGCTRQNVWRILTKMCGLYCLTLFGSIGVYRVFFHRLSRFPGPFVARATKLWHFRKCSNLQNYSMLHGLHEQYGEFVRTGPSELTISHPDVHNAIDGPGSTCHKSDWYDTLLPNLSLVSCRDRKSHDLRRRVWDRAFGKKAFGQYESILEKYATQLERCVASLTERQKPIDALTLFRWFSWDVMGEVMFSKSFDMLQNEAWHTATFQVRRAMDFLGYITPAPWVARFGFTILPFLGVVRDWSSMVAFCHQRIEERIATGFSGIDISSYLIDEAKKNGITDADWCWLHGDSVLGVIAGSDTVVAALSFLFYRLAEHPHRADILYDELAHIDAHDAKALQSLPYLNSLINETLRLHPPIPSGGARQTPPEGLRIGDVFIPGGITIVAPRFTTARLETCFEQAKEFRPERWSSDPGMIKTAKTFVPFGTGRFSCVGKNLGLAELRVAAASLVKQYKIHYANGEDGRFVESQMTDTFTSSPGRLMLQFSARC